MKSALVAAVPLLLAGVLLCAGSDYGGRARHALLEKQFPEQINIWRSTGQETALFQETIKEWRFTAQDRRALLNGEPVKRQGAVCSICRSVLQQLIDKRHHENASREELFETVYGLCVALQIQEEPVCYGAIDINIDFFLHIFDTRPNLNADSVCGVVFQNSGCLLNDTQFTDWTVNVSERPSPITGPKQSSGGRSPNDIKIVQITDIHYDTYYREDHNAACGLPICCRSDQGVPDSVENRAGRWGDYRDCDSPWNAVEDVVTRVRDEHSDAAYIYHTGDIIEHAVWETSTNHNLAVMDQVYGKLREAFATVPVYNIIGNHEAHPTNVFKPSSAHAPAFEMDWLYNYLSQEWGHWLPESTRDTIRRGGFYTSIVRPGLRIVALNNQDCYTNNWWILYDPGHLAVQLQWLHDVLHIAEQNGEKVHLLAHIPYSSSGSTFHPCQREFRRIVERFSETISAQFNGHTHEDEFNIYYSNTSPSHAVNVAWNGGSVTPFSNKNPNYIVYYVNPDTYEVTDFESYFYNLTAANLEPDSRPQWERLYSFAEEFNMPNLSPAEADKVVTRWGTPAGRDELYRYWQFTVKMGDPSLEAGCDDDCLLNTLCYVVRNQMDDNSRCDELRATFNE